MVENTDAANICELYSINLTKDNVSTQTDCPGMFMLYISLCRLKPTQKMRKFPISPGKYSDSKATCTQFAP